MFCLIRTLKSEASWHRLPGPMQIGKVHYEKAAAGVDDCPVDGLAEFAFIGRSNVGKSALINSLSGRKDLCRVSKTPGRTRLIHFMMVDGKWRLVDLPGYGFVKSGKKDREVFEEMIGRYFVERDSLRCCFLLIDSRHSPQAVDLDFAAWMVANAVPFVVVFTKCDKPKAAVLRRNIDAFLEAMKEFASGSPRVFRTSSRTGEGRRELLRFISECLAGPAAG